MQHDVWITKVGKGLWYVWAEPGEPPTMPPERAKSVREIFRRVKRAGISIGQVGIADRSMLGLD